MTGRPTKCEPATVARIVTALESGMSLRQAAVACGVSRDALNKWRKRGEAGEEPYATFVDQTTRARAVAEERMAAVVVAAAQSGDSKTSLNAATWWLERRRPERWARRDKPEVQIRTEDPRTLTREQLVARVVQLSVAEGLLPPGTLVPSLTRDTGAETATHDDDEHEEGDE